MGIASLSATLKRAGHEVNLFDFSFIDNDQINRAFAAKLSAFHPDLIAISCRSLEFRYVIELLRSLEGRYKKVPIVIGGVHATVVPDEVLAISQVDAIVRGEGEYPLLELVTNLEKGEHIGGIPNVWTKKKGQVIKNDVRPLLDDLDVLPFPDFDLFDDRHFVQGISIQSRLVDKRVGAVEASRGCPYSCSYCVNAFLQGLTRGKSKYHREKSVRRAVDEIAYYVERFRLEYIYFIDETFLFQPHRLREFAGVYKQRVGLPFSFMTHPQTVTEEKIQIIAEAGADMALVGIECGDEGFRRSVLHRPVTDLDIRQAFRIIKKYGIPTYSFNVIGFPGENRGLIQRTINLNREVRPDYVQVTICYPFPGTELLKTSTEHELIDKKKQIDSYYEDSVLRLPGFGKGQLARICRLFPYYVRAPWLLLPFLALLERVPFLFGLFFYAPRYLSEVRYVPGLLRRHGLLGLAEKINARTSFGKALRSAGRRG